MNKKYIPIIIISIALIIGVGAIIIYNKIKKDRLDNELYNKLMQRLTQGLFIQYEAYDIIPTQRFRQGMSMINRNGNIRRVGEQDA